MKAEEKVPDYSDYQQQPISSDALASLSRLAEAQKAAELEVSKAEDELQKANDKLRDIAEREIPTLMQTLGLTTVKTSSGLIVAVEEKLRASVAGEKGQAAIKWLDDHNHGDLIKREIVIQFNKDEKAWAAKFMRDLRQRKKPVRAEENLTVHNSTLVSFLKERLAEGDDIPLPLFGAYFQKRSKIKTS